MPTGVYKHKPDQGFRKGHIISELTREKIKLAQIGNKNVLGKHWKVKDTSRISVSKIGNTNGFKKGQVSWNKGNKGFLEGEIHYAWKGDKVGYRCLHLWVIRKLGKAKKCEYCGKEKTTPKSIHWANKSHKYLRDLTDWIQLCVSCHKNYDIKSITL